MELRRETRACGGGALGCWKPPRPGRPCWFAAAAAFFLFFFGRLGVLVGVPVEEGQYALAAGETRYPLTLPRQNPDPFYSVGPYPMSIPELPKLAGSTLVASYCSGCHTTQYLLMQPKLSRAAWEKIVKKMTDSFGAPVPQELRSQILAYLEALSSLKGKKTSSEEKMP
jgi:hypothetical protein